MKLARALLVLMLLTMSLPSNATINGAYGYMQQIDTRHMPAKLIFSWSGNSTLCNPGAGDEFTGTNWLWAAATNTDTNKAMYAAVLSGLLSGKQIYIEYDTTTCQVFNIRPTNSP